MKGRCPTCRGVATKQGNKLWPFCSERCYFVDLGRWLNEEYRIPEEKPDGQDGAAESAPPDDER